MNSSLVHLVRRIEWEVCDSAAGAVLRLTLTRDMSSPGKVFGAFKGAMMAFASLCRFLFIAGNDDVNFNRFLARLLTTPPLRSQRFD